MNLFIGTKRISATPMTRLAYNNYRGWDLPANKNGEDLGYLVEYLDGGKSNDDRHIGYISWSPAEQFEAAYRPMNRMTFGDALIMLKHGHRVTRAGWNGKGMWLMYVSPQMANKIAFEFEDRDGQPYIVMKTAQGLIVPWVASQSDMLDEDWQLA
jgi:hypothetical protein